MQKFELKRIANISPGCGEDLGGALNRFATEEEARFRANPQAKVMYWASTVVQLLYLAAEAFEAGANASIGHGRSGRYDQAARDLRLRAVALADEAERQRSDVESECLLTAVETGFKGLDIFKYSFDRFDAGLIGKNFRRLGKDVPERINGVRPYKQGHYLVDGKTYRIDCPSGRRNEAVVVLVD